MADSGLFTDPNTPAAKPSPDDPEPREPRDVAGEPIGIAGYIDHQILSSTGDPINVHSMGIITVNPQTGKKVEAPAKHEAPEKHEKHAKHAKHEVHE